MNVTVAKFSGFNDINTRNRRDEIKLFFETAFITLLAFREDIISHSKLNLYGSLQEFLEAYPDFEIQPQDEKEKLFEFANWLKYAMILITPKWQKGHLLGNNFVSFCAL